MDPVSITAGAIGVAGVGGQVFCSARDIIHDYRHAGVQIRHARSQLSTLEINLGDPSLLDAKRLAVHTSLGSINESFPRDLRFDSKKERLRWAVGKRKDVSSLLDQLKETEVSATFALQLEQL